MYHLLNIYIYTCNDKEEILYHIRNLYYMLCETILPNKNMINFYYLFYRVIVEKYNQRSIIKAKIKRKKCRH